MEQGSSRGRDVSGASPWLVAGPVASLRPLGWDWAGSGPDTRWSTSTAGLITSRHAVR